MRVRESWCFDSSHPHRITLGPRERERERIFLSLSHAHTHAHTHTHTHVCVCVGGGEIGYWTILTSVNQTRDSQSTGSGDHEDKLVLVLHETGSRGLGGEG